jgi:IclR family transcriptional regulator, pca regulon regulatory protein
MGTPVKSVDTSRETMGGLAKGLAVLLAFSRENPAMTLSELAQRTGLAPATARRCLRTFEALGYVTRSGRHFLLRPKVLEIGAAYLESIDVDTLTRNHLEEMAHATGDSAALSVLDGTEIVYVARASVRTLVRLEAHVGSHFPAFATSMGRVLLAGLGAERLEEYFARARFDALTRHTEIDPARLRKTILDVRRTGYALVEDELAYGVIALAVPVHDSARRVVASLNSSSHTKKTTRATLLKSRLPMLFDVSARISRELARVPGLALSTRT